ncbi:DMT family transporter [Geobacter sp. SVR]|uniref:DMT family transporter n=1 Tax=Geobacter sp. SVR TaxID=2495594 RepID=UPI00143EFF49|nr:DMT family transporter [Geobacter sp. SVR]BCS52846.1 membrane protein [Geobacter sp. SVR]GCF86713.1 membrane protein [Geobacter sp. SVR]
MTFNRFKAAVLLLTTTFFWGVTFTIVKQAIESVDVFVFLAQRFMLAFMFILPVCFFKGGRLDGATIRQGCIMGIFLFGAYAFQTVALLYTSASNTGFLTGLNVVMVPVIASFTLRHRIPGTIKLAVVLSVCGLFLLCGNGSWRFNGGDILAAICAVCVSLHLIYTGEFTRTSDYFWLTAVQLGMVALLSVAVALGRGKQVFVWYPHLLTTLLVCSLIATVFAFLVQTSMQRFISHTNTALIFCTEPVFAAAYAWLAIDERLGLFGLLGALLIMVGMLLSILPAARETAAAEEPLDVAELEEYRIGE